MKSNQAWDEAKIYKNEKTKWVESLKHGKGNRENKILRRFLQI